MGDWNKCEHELGAVLTYTSSGRSGVHGMTIGADGSGNFAVLFIGTSAEAENAATEYLRRLRRAGYRISAAHIVPNEQLFTGTTIRVVGAPLPGMEAPNAVLSGAATETTTECGASPRPPRTRG